MTSLLELVRPDDGVGEIEQEEHPDDCGDYQLYGHGSFSLPKRIVRLQTAEQQKRR
jgi:hypothetical protein